MIIDFSKYKLEILLFILFFYSLIFCNLSKSRVLFIESNDEAKSYFSGIPNIYQAVERIGSSGTQYIDTGIIGENKYRINTKFIFTSLGSSSDDITLIGSTGTSRPSYMSYIKKRAVGGGAYWSQMVGSSYNSTDWTTPTLGTNIEYTIDAKLSTSGNYMNINGVNHTWSYTSSYTSGYTMYIFGSNNGGSFGGGFSGNLFYMQIFNLSDELVQDLVPCYRKSDNVIGMYDKVSGTFFTNAGSGTFTKGGNV